MNWTWAHIILYIGVPVLFLGTVLYVFLHDGPNAKKSKRYQVKFKVKSGRFQIDNIKRCASVIDSAGTGKTESVVYNFLKHFSQHSFCGLIHDYKHFELAEIAYPLYKAVKVPFYVISFDMIYHWVNPIAPVIWKMRKVSTRFQGYLLKICWSKKNQLVREHLNFLPMPQRGLYNLR